MLSKTVLAVKKWWINLFSLEPTEKDAIRGHSVDRYAYAVTLIKEGSNESLIKAYAWLLVAAEEIDRKKPAKLLLHQLQFGLKQLGIFEKAEKTGEEYMYLYSAEGTMRALRASKNPVNYLVRFGIYMIEAIITRIEFLDHQFIKNRGNQNTWMAIAFISWCCLCGAIWFFSNNAGIFSSMLLTFAMLSMFIACGIWDLRVDDEESKL